MTLHGIDAQGRVTNWANVKASGVSFAVFRCVGENGVVDPDYAANVAGAKANGIVPGAYHFIAGGTSAAHCRKFMDTIGNPEGLLVVVDVERPNYHPAPTIGDVRVWFETFRSRYPKHPVVLYTGGWFWKGVMGNPVGSTLTPTLWNSNYSATIGSGWDISFGGWAGPTFWQYRGSGPLRNGLSAGAQVDLNFYKGDLTGLKRLTVSSPSLTTGASSMAITGGGLVRTSDYAVLVPAGTACFNDAALTKLRTKVSGTEAVALEYFGIADDGPNSYAVEVTTGTGFSDGISRPVILFVSRAAVGKPYAKPVPVPVPVDNTELLAKLALAQAALETALAAEAAAKAAAVAAEKARVAALAEADASDARADSAITKWNAAQAELTRGRTFIAAAKALGL